jgi:hypothetical protein
MGQEVAASLVRVTPNLMLSIYILSTVKKKKEGI